MMVNTWYKKNYKWLQGWKDFGDISSAWSNQKALLQVQLTASRKRERERERESEREGFYRNCTAKLNLLKLIEKSIRKKGIKWIK